MFSSSLGKTLPLASHAMQVGGVDGSAKMMGPVMSDGASAVTQLSSSSVVEVVGSVVVRAVELGSWLSRPDSVAGCFLFFDLLSPLKARGLTMMRNAYSTRRPRTGLLAMPLSNFLVARLVATRELPAARPASVALIDKSKMDARMHLESKVCSSPYSLHLTLKYDSPRQGRHVTRSSDCKP